jgi:glutathione S-transferase
MYLGTSVRLPPFSPVLRPMLTVHARVLDPLSRAVRIALGEKRAVFHVREVPAFSADAQLLALDPDGRTPVLVDNAWGQDAAISELWALFEYLDELIPTPPLFPGGPLERASARAIAVQAIRAFKPLVDVVVLEKALKRIERAGPPDIAALRQAQDGAASLIEQAGHAAETADGWLCGRKLSLADVVAAAQVSVLDQLDAIDWARCPMGKAWYAKIKQRPSFRPILADVLPSITSAAHYTDLDF